MAFGYDGSVRIKADLNHSNFDKGLSTMTGKVQSLGKTLTKLAGLVGVAFGTAALVRFTKEAVNAASALSDAWMGLQSIVEGQGKSFSKAKSFINDYISDGLVPLENAVTAYKNLAARGYSTEQIETTMTALKDAAAFGRQASYSLGDAVTSATEGLKNENSILVDNAGVTKNVAKMWEDYAKSIGTTSANLTQEQKIQAEVNGILEETRFQTGDAAKLVNTYSGQIALLGYNFQNLKVQVGNAIMPIAQAVLPGINAIISALTKLATVFAQVTALLFGKSAQTTATSGIASSASAAADATDQLAAATEGAGDASKQAAKDMKGVLAGFDELNILADDTASSLGDAAGGIDAGASDAEIPSYESEIEEAEQLGESFKSLGELFVKSLDNILGAMPAFKQALLDFAESFNDFNQTLYDAFTFPGVLERVKQFGVELADAFNGLASAINWELWGRTLGAGLNVGLNFLTAFIYEFNWIDLGSKLADLFSGLVYEIDWYEFGRLLWARFKIGLETFAGFIVGLDMPALAQAASDIAIGFFNSMQETIANIDWAEVGSQIAEFLNNVDWVGVITSVAGALSEMVGAGLDLIGGFIENADIDTLLIAVGFLASKLLPDIVTGIIAPMAKDLVGGFIESIATSFAASGFSGVISTIATALSSLVSPVGIVIAAVGALIAIIALLALNFEEVGTAISDLYDNHIAPFVESVVESFQEWFDHMVEGFNAYIKPVLDEFSEKFTEVVEHHIVPMVEKAIKFFGKIFDALKELWNNILSPLVKWIIDSAMPIIAGVLENIGKKFNTFLADVSDVVGAIFEILGGVIDFLVGAFTGDWERAWNGVKNIFSGIIDGIIGLFKGAIDFIGGLVGGIFSTIGNLAQKIAGLGSNARALSAKISTGDGRMATSALPATQTYNLPRLANGAVIPPNQQFAAILGDQRSGMNIEAPANLIKQMVFEGITEAMSASGSSGQPIEVTLMIDKQKLGRVMVPVYNGMTMQMGKPVFKF